MKGVEVVHVKWIDAEASCEWENVEDINPEKLFVHTIGILIYRSPEYIVICATFDPHTNTINASQSIPMALVEKITPIAMIDTEK